MNYKINKPNRPLSPTPVDSSQPRQAFSTSEAPPPALHTDKSRWPDVLKGVSLGTGILSWNTFCSMENTLILQTMGAKLSGHLLISRNWRKQNGFIYLFYLQLSLNSVYKVTLTTVLMMYHSWIHPLHRSSLSSQSPKRTVWNRHTGICMDSEGFRSTDPSVQETQVLLPTICCPAILRHRDDCCREASCWVRASKPSTPEALRSSPASTKKNHKILKGLLGSRYFSHFLV
jgi:hypothetical protein